MTDAPDADGSTRYVVSKRIGPVDARVLVQRSGSTSTTSSSTATSWPIILPKTRNAEPTRTGSSDIRSTRVALGFHLTSFAGSATNSNATEGGTAVSTAIMCLLTRRSSPLNGASATTGSAQLTKPAFSGRSDPSAAARSGTALVGSLGEQIADSVRRHACSRSQALLPAQRRPGATSAAAEIADGSDATLGEVGDLVRRHLGEAGAQEHSEADRGRTVLRDACRDLLEPGQAFLGRVRFVQ